MFIVGVAFMSVGYALAYYGVDVLSWSRSAVADKTRPVPLRYLLGVGLPTTPPKDEFHPPFTLNSTDRANATIALGAAAPAPLPAGAAIAPPGGDTSAGPGTDPGGQTIIPRLPGETTPNTAGAV